MNRRVRTIGAFSGLVLGLVVWSGEGSRSCVPVEPQTPGDPVTGSACEEAADCGPGYDCYTLAPGGDCMAGAPGGPTACREPEAPCPDGTVCSPLPWHAISGVCLAPCATAADCRPGYRCGHVELFPGDVDTPRSAEAACWFVCEPGMDQMCNDNPIISSLHGTCQEDGTCACHEGFPMNPETGRCR